MGCSSLPLQSFFSFKENESDQLTSQKTVIRIWKNLLQYGMASFIIRLRPNEPAPRSPRSANDQKGDRPMFFIALWPVRQYPSIDGVQPEFHKKGQSRENKSHTWRYLLWTSLVSIPGKLHTDRFAAKSIVGPYGRSRFRKWADHTYVWFCAGAFRFSYKSTADRQSLCPVRFLHITAWVLTRRNNYYG